MRVTWMVFAFSVLTLAACGDNNPAKPALCGDGVVAGDEACDDGNTVDDDQCNNSCQVVGCGDGIVSFTEACDDGNRIDGDGCDSNCTETFCGNGIMTADEACDDGNTMSGDGCDANCRPTGCGNGAVGGTEECDDGNDVNGDGCDMNCKTTACGNGIMTGTEQCDDGNTTPLDGCSSTCGPETAEMEPNDDGTPDTDAPDDDGNDFDTANPDMNDEITASTTIVAAIMPEGDEDIFKITNTGTKPVILKLDTWNLETGFGIGVSCGDTSIDTVLNIRNAAGDVLDSNNDRDFTDYCSALVYPLGAGETIYAQVLDWQDDDVIASYALDVIFEPVVCGDGDVGPGEQCDDSNSATGDGCSDTCQIENAEAEVEPNEDGMTETGGDTLDGNDFGTAYPDMYAPTTSSKTILATIMPAGDEDVFVIKNTGTTGATVQLDTWNLGSGYGIGVPCGTSIDTVMHVRNAAGESLASNDDRDGFNDFCSTLTVPLLPNETRYVHVLDRSDDGLIGMYGLQIKFTQALCGDMMSGPGEQCDDGNTTSGDGCDSTCQFEQECGDGVLQPPEQCDDMNTTAGDGCNATCDLEMAVTEMEPNEDGNVITGGTGIDGNDFAIANADANTVYSGSVTIAATIDPAGDEDVFKFTNPGSTYAIVTFDTWNLAPMYGLNVACGTSIDTGLTLRDATGDSLASNDDRNGTTDQCAGLSYDMAPGATVYAHVVKSGDNAAIASYALEVSYAPVVCGDTMVGPDEECDDGNTMDGDGCDSTCHIEPVCGDTMLQTGEQCDDGNTMDGDGCSSTCQVEGATSEHEPNEDGTPEPGGDFTEGNDFSIVNADINAPITGTSMMVASLMPAGDEDVFKVTNPGPTAVDIKFDTWDLALGIGVSCGTVGVDTVLNVRDAMGNVLESNNDRDFSDYCSSLTYSLLPGESIYLQVVDWLDDGTVASYALQVRFTPVVCGDNDIGLGEQCDDGNTVNGDGCDSMCQFEVVCGDNVVHPGEQCDDGNTMDGDGCSSTCQVEGAISEMEPNDDGTPSPDGDSSEGNDFAIAGADANGPVTADATIVASLTPAGDEDVFKITNTGAGPADVQLDVWDISIGVGVSCGTSGIDTVLNVRDAAGNIRASNNDRDVNTDYCSALKFPLQAGETIYVQVLDYFDDNTIPSYALQVHFIPAVCGDGAVGGGEECDDGNTIAGDGCNATCQTEVMEVEPNDDGMTSPGAANGIYGNDFGTANPDANESFTSSVVVKGAITPAGDEDIFKFTNTGATSKNVRFDLWNAAPGFGVGIPCAESIDTGLVVRDSTAAELDSNDDRASADDRCSGIDFTIGAGESVYVHVIEYGDDAEIPGYIFSATYAP